MPDPGLELRLQLSFGQQKFILGVANTGKLGREFKVHLTEKALGNLATLQAVQMLADCKAREGNPEKPPPVPLIKLVPIVGHQDIFEVILTDAGISVADQIRNQLSQEQFTK